MARDLRNACGGIRTPDAPLWEAALPLSYTAFRHIFVWLRRELHQTTLVSQTGFPEETIPVGFEPTRTHNVHCSTAELRPFNHAGIVTPTPPDGVVVCELRWVSHHHVVIDHHLNVAPNGHLAVFALHTPISLGRDPVMRSVFGSFENQKLVAYVVVLTAQRFERALDPEKAGLDVWITKVLREQRPVIHVVQQTHAQILQQSVGDLLVSKPAAPPAYQLLRSETAWTRTRTTPTTEVSTTIVLRLPTSCFSPSHLVLGGYM